MSGLSQAFETARRMMERYRGLDWSQYQTWEWEADSLLAKAVSLGRVYFATHDSKLIPVLAYDYSGELARTARGSFYAPVGKLVVR